VHLCSRVDPKENRIMLHLRTRFIMGAWTIVALTAVPAAAVSEPAATGSAQLGRLSVSSTIAVGPTTVEMMGGWRDTAAACARRARLDVGMLIDRVQDGRTKRVRRRVSRAVECEESVPNLGLVIRARSVGLGCPDGTWAPGIYSFVTNTLHRARRLRAVAALYFTVEKPCS
jgi:hypothetical protein